MAKLNIPQSGENILAWAKKATREINSLQPTEGQGQKITKTANGTTYSVDKSTISFPDSQPKIVNEISSDSVSLSVAFGTTYSIEKNEQNAFSMFGFSELTGNHLKYHVSSDIDFVLRDRGTKEAILSSPTVRYVSVSALLADILNGEDGDDGLSGSPFGITPDSEVIIPNGNPASYSIQHNSQNALALYHFEELASGDFIDEIDPEEDYVLVRHKSGNNPPVLKYTHLSGLTENINVVISVDYSSSTHKLTQTTRLLHFENGLLISADNAVNSVILEAVPEQI